MSKSSIETTTNVTENYILSTSISDENIIIKVNGPSQAIKFTPQYSLRIKPETLKKKYNRLIDLPFLKLNHSLLNHLNQIHLK